MKSFLTLILFALCSFAARAEVRLPDVIGSSMVLQQKQGFRSGELRNPAKR